MAKSDKKLKGLKKIWVKIIAPQVFGEQEIGQSYVYNPEELLNRYVKVNLMLLTNDIKKQNTMVKFKITEIKNNCAYASLLGYEVNQLSFKKLVRRKKTKVTNSFVMMTKDNACIRFKTIFVTVSKACSMKIKQLQYVILKEVFLNAKEKDYGALVVQLISGELQSKLRAKLERIYPVKFFDVYYANTEVSKKPHIVDEEAISRIKVRVGNVVAKQFRPRHTYMQKNGPSRNRSENMY